MENASKLILGAITDEFSPDLTVAVAAMAELGLTSAELRLVGSRNVVELSVREVREAKRLLSDHGIEIPALAAPLLKCECPGTGEIQEGTGRDIFGSAYSYADQRDLAKRTFEVANEAGASIVRVFSFWRVPDPAGVFDRIAEELRALAEVAERSGVIIGLGHPLVEKLKTRNGRSSPPAISANATGDPSSSWRNTVCPRSSGSRCLAAVVVVAVMASPMVEIDQWSRCYDA